MRRVSTQRKKKPLASLGLQSLQITANTQEYQTRFILAIKRQIRIYKIRKTMCIHKNL